MATLGGWASGTHRPRDRCEACVLGVLVGLLSWTTGARADEPQLGSATLKAVKRSTVYLGVTLGDRRTIQGSGFFTGEPGLVLTNAHVIGMGKDEGDFPDRIDVVVNSGQDDERTYLGQVVGVDPELDLALIRVVGNDDLPPPLNVASGRELEETQTVFIFGFPLGRELGKQITVSKTSISSLRKDDSGLLERIQVNGGMHPGNSGGPVVDARGQVVGVAVAVIRNTQLHLAVPGDRVRDFLGGRVGSVRVGKPRPRGANLVATVRVSLIDPMNRVRSVSLDYWLGSQGKSRPTGSIPHLPVKGESPRQSLSLRLAEGVAEGQWTIPLPGEGQVIWAQPRLLS
jgi:Trypsin-like peptidase domain